MWRRECSAGFKYRITLSIETLAKENKNKSFVLRIDSDTMEAIEKWAADEFRSTNGQILYLLDQALQKSGRKLRKTDKA
ncbi:hypothetical protein SDC9_187936 [bioreactor metagenome]|uniref:Arc-like DNA binding domain-containing protein n=1 Tax=bioreactor metagenome TaxID=1076179 RepID=A0A645HQ88_9ZZZZ